MPPLSYSEVRELRQAEYIEKLRARILELEREFTQAEGALDAIRKIVNP